MKPGQTKVMIPQTHKIITEITIGYLTMPFPVVLQRSNLLVERNMILWR